MLFKKTSALMMRNIFIYKWKDKIYIILLREKNLAANKNYLIWILIFEKIVASNTDEWLLRVTLKGTKCSVQGWDLLIFKIPKWDPDGMGFKKILDPKIFWMSDMSLRDESHVMKF